MVLIYFYFMFFLKLKRGYSTFKGSVIGIGQNLNTASVFSVETGIMAFFKIEVYAL